MVSISRSVDINDGETPVSGVLLIDMKYSIIEEALDRINEDTNGIYYYLCNSDGELIYHPRKVEIDRGIISEESTRIAGYEDGTYELNLNGGRANYIISSIAYTGWKVVGVVPDKIQTISINKFRYYVIITLIFLIMMLLVVNKNSIGKNIQTYIKS